MEQVSYRKGFIPYALSALLIGLVGGFSTVLGPAFVQDIGIDYSNTTWTALAQAMSTAACAPVLGRLGDMIGRKATLLLGIVVYTVGNAFSGTVDSLVWMLAARFIIGAGSAAIAPVTMVYIVSEFPKAEVAKGFALYMLISSASVVVGPAIGGVMVARWGWRSVVWLCTGICLAVLAACLATLGRDQSRRSPITHFDVPGAILVPVFFSLVLCIPSFGQNFGWGTRAFIGVLIASLVSLALLIQFERRAAVPILSGAFMRRRAFLLSVLALFLTQGLMQANMTNTIVFVNYTQSGNSALSGYAISVMYIGMSLGAVLLGPLADRYEPKRVLVCSLAVTGAGCALMWLFSQRTPLWLLMASLGVLGFGLGGNGTIFMKVVLSGIPAESAGAGTGTYGLFRDLSAPFGVAVFVPMFTNGITKQIALGIDASVAAVSGVHELAAAEIACVAAGIAAVVMLPKIHQKG